MDTNKQDSDNSPASNLVSPKATVPSTQPVPKKEDKILANNSTNSESTKSDSNPTL